MAFLSARERAFLDDVSRLGYCNPFLPERVELERAALGPEFVEGEPVWSRRDEDRPRANAWRVAERAAELIERLRPRLAEGAGATGRSG